MKNIFYMAPSLIEAIIFIEINTDWKKVTGVSFRNGDENIVVIDNLMRMRGRHIDGIYIDHSFSSIPEDIQYELKHRFDTLGIQPVTLEDKRTKMKCKNGNHIIGTGDSLVHLDDYVESERKHPGMFFRHCPNCGDRLEFIDDLATKYEQYSLRKDVVGD